VRSGRAVAAVVGSGILLLAGCSSGVGSSSSTESEEVTVVATTTIWADVARQVAECAGGGTVSSLMPVGADPHDFTASSRDVVTMSEADLVIANGLGLEEGLEASLDAARQEGAEVLELASLLSPLPFGDHADDDAAAGEDADHDRGHGSEDPHVWLDVSRVAAAARIIGDRLAEQTGSADFARCGAEVSDSLADLNAEVVQILSVIPADRRILVTDHDAFGYFADTYDFKVAGVVIPGGSTLAQPSSADMADVATTIKQTGVPAIFANTANPQALVDALATEVGDIQVVDLFVGSLGAAGSGADTYQGMMRTDAQRIATALSD
jgi:zinc/manganese transport system substrate-binding protein